MLIFFDTEFTDLCADPKLISIGLVAEDGRKFYAELSDTYTEADCSDFVLEAVLPNLEGGDARMTMNECASRILRWLMDFGEHVQLATDSLAWDWPWIQELLVESSRGTSWPSQMTKHTIAIAWRPSSIEGEPFILSLTPEFNQAAEDGYQGGLRRHHALDDAKANRLGWLASNGGNK